jgi:sugar O-acyltransferase (sialic acid O-acetyltransferase NeuD family)
MAKILIVGAGGHGREVADILRAQHELGGPEPAGFLDSNRSLHGTSVAGLPVLGDWEFLQDKSRGEFQIIVGVGDPKLMKKLSQQAASLGIPFGNAVSPKAVISPGATLGQGVIVFPNCFVSVGSALGNHVTLNVGSSVSHDSTVGDYSSLNPGARLGGTVRVGEGVYIGMGAHVIQNIRIGDWSVIGAGATIIRDVEPGTTVVGVPGHSIKPGPTPA